MNTAGDRSQSVWMMGEVTMEAKIIGTGGRVETYCLMVPHSKARERVMGRVCIIIWRLVCQRDPCLRCSQLQAMQAHLLALQGYVFCNLHKSPRNIL